MKQIRTIVLSALLLLPLAGCSITGKWSLTNVDPSAARRDFPYEVLTLEKDGSFYAEAKEPTTQTTSGTYRYEKGVLSLSEHDKEKHTYDAELRDSGNQLRLTRPWTDRRMTADLKRVQ